MSTSAGNTTTSNRTVNAMREARNQTPQQRAARTRRRNRRRAQNPEGYR